MPKKVGGSGGNDHYRLVNTGDDHQDSSGKDRLSRPVSRTSGKPYFRLVFATRQKLLAQRSIAQKTKVTPYHRAQKGWRNGFLPSINDRPFHNFWKVRDGARDFRDTVDHRVMEVRDTEGNSLSIDGAWHIKSPGKESGRERFKRFLQKVAYFILRQPYKGHYFDDHKLLVQKEVLASNLYRSIVLAEREPDEQFAREFQCGYSYDETGDRHCVAMKHLEGYKDASTLFHKNIEGVQHQIFDERHNPASNLVIRRFFLGDEDYLKLDNYMYKTNSDIRARTRMYCIDFGMAFYNLFRLPKECTLAQFKEKLLTKSQKHEAQYRDVPDMMAVIRLMNPGQVESGIHWALTRIASLSDEFLVRQVSQIYDDQARQALLAVLFHKRQQARAMLYLDKFSWPSKLAERVSGGLVARRDRYS